MTEREESSVKQLQELMDIYKFNGKVLGMLLGVSATTIARMLKVEYKPHRRIIPQINFLHKVFTDQDAKYLQARIIIKDFCKLGDIEIPPTPNRSMVDVGSLLACAVEINNSIREVVNLDDPNNEVFINKYREDLDRYEHVTPVDSQRMCVLLFMAYDSGVYDDILTGMMIMYKLESIKDGFK